MPVFDAKDHSAPNLSQEKRRGQWAPRRCPLTSGSTSEEETEHGDAPGQELTGVDRRGDERVDDQRDEQEQTERSEEETREYLEGDPERLRRPRRNQHGTTHGQGQGRQGEGDAEARVPDLLAEEVGVRIDG